MLIAKLFCLLKYPVGAFLRFCFSFLVSCVVIVTAKLHPNLYIGITVQFCKILAIIFSKVVKTELIFRRK